VLAAVSGVFYGMCFAPVIYVQDNYPNASQNGEYIRILFIIHLWEEPRELMSFTWPIKYSVNSNHSTIIWSPFIASQEFIVILRSGTHACIQKRHVPMGWFFK
jgi:hypothetical protein